MTLIEMIVLMLIIASIGFLVIHNRGLKHDLNDYKRINVLNRKTIDAKNKHIDALKEAILAYESIKEVRENIIKDSNELINNLRFQRDELYNRLSDIKREVSELNSLEKEVGDIHPNDDHKDMKGE